MADRIEAELIVRAISEGFEKIGKDLKGVADATDKVKASNEKNSTSFTELKAKMDLASGALSKVKDGFVAVFNFAKEGATIKRTADTFDALAASVDGTADSMLGKLKAATGGAVTDLELMSSANRFLAMGLADSEDSAAKLSQTAVTLGQAMGEEAGASMENFALLLANQSIPRLDSFGISSGVVRERIKELTTGVDALDKETAFMTAVMEQADVTMEKIGQTGGATADNFTRLEVSASNLWNSLKVGVSEALDPVAESLADTADGAASVTTALDNGRSAWTNVLTVAQELHPELKLLTEDYVDQRQKVEDAANSNNKLSKELDTTTDAVVRGRPEMVGYADGLARIKQEAEEMAAQFVVSQETLDTWGISISNNILNADTFAEKMVFMATETDGFTEALNAAFGGTELLSGGLEEISKSATDSKDAQNEFNASVASLKEQATSGEISLKQFNASMSELTGEADTASSSLGKVGEFINGLGDKTVTVSFVSDTSGFNAPNSYEASGLIDSGGGVTSTGDAFGHSGLDFIVGPGYNEAAGRPKMFGAESGERVTITPAGDIGNGIGGSGSTVNVYVSGARATPQGIASAVSQALTPAG
ncbi:MAG: hypothetical protein GY938_16640 [Ketobacter sp.]|nr:hypothetical protein [Ketobacter sp.]